MPARSFFSSLVSSLSNYLLHTHTRVKVIIVMSKKWKFMSTEVHANSLATVICMLNVCQNSGCSSFEHVWPYRLTQSLGHLKFDLGYFSSIHSNEIWPKFDHLTFSSERLLCLPTASESYLNLLVNSNRQQQRQHLSH